MDRARVARRFPEAAQAQGRATPARGAPAGERGHGADLQRALRDPGGLAAGLAAADGGTRARAMTSLQQLGGNRATGSAVTMTARGHGSGEADERDGAAPAPAPAPAPAAPPRREHAPGATEEIGPPSLRTYAVEAATLGEFAEAVSGRSEAGRVEWSLGMSSTNADGVVDSAHVSAAIALEMPDWTPPRSMSRAARAEWRRAYDALATHEQGHIELVEQRMGGVADELIGMRPRAASRRFARARDGLATASAAYDAETSHGAAQGTTIDTSLDASAGAREDALPAAPAFRPRRARTPGGD